MLYQAIESWIRQRPGLDPRNYISDTAYRADSRRITRQLHDAQELLRACLLHDISEADLAAEMTHRLTWNGLTLDYTVGQYWPTEYRAAACRALSGALWRKYGPTARTMVARQVARRWLS